MGRCGFWLVLMYLETFKHYKVSQISHQTIDSKYFRNNINLIKKNTRQIYLNSKNFLIFLYALNIIFTNNNLASYISALFMALYTQTLTYLVIHQLDEIFADITKSCKDNKMNIMNQKTHFMHPIFHSS